MNQGPTGPERAPSAGTCPARAAALPLIGAGPPLRPSSSGARPYVIAVLVAGCAVLARSAMEFSATVPPAEWWVLVAVTLISGSAVLKIPSVPVNFSISDVFTLTTAVVFGPAAGTLIVAVDSLSISIRLARTGLPVQRGLFNAAAPPVAMWISATAFFHASGLEPLHSRPVAIDYVFPWLLLFAGCYFLLNTFAIAVAIALDEGKNAVRIWRSHFQNLWLSFVGGALGAAFVVFALQLGAYAIVMVSVPLLLAFILHFAYRHATGRLSDQLHHLAEVNRLHLSTIEALAHAIDAKDAVTHQHIRRVQRWAVALAVRLGVDDEQQQRAIEAAALLHDIGKLAVPEHILNKPGKLTDAEFELMKSHARVGAEILSEVEFPYPVVPIVRHHHEAWDGTGYPDGLRGTSIPIGARILSVVDCFDALTSDRPYRRALSGPDALAILEARRGTMYEPAIVDAFRDVWTWTECGDGGAPDPHTQAVPFAPPTGPREGAAKHEDALRLAIDLGAALSRGSGCEDESPWRVLAEALSQVTGVDTAAIFVVDEEQQRLVPVHTAGRHARAVWDLAIPVGERVSGWVAASRQSIINADARLDLLEVPSSSLRSAIAVPGTGPAGTSFVLTLYATTEAAFSSLHERLLGAAVGFTREAPPRPRARLYPAARDFSSPGWTRERRAVGLDVAR